jgi:hypothetical protein
MKEVCRTHLIQNKYNTKKKGVCRTHLMEEPKQNEQDELTNRLVTMGNLIKAVRRSRS